MDGGIVSVRLRKKRGYRQKAYLMEINKLDAATVKNAKPRDKEYSLGDGTGLLLVRPNGGKLWEFNRKEKLMSYGPYPAVSLAQARVLHDAARAMKRQGTDPAAAKAENKSKEHALDRSSAPTFAALTTEWKKAWSKGKSARYVATVNTRLERDILPAVGNVPIDQLDKRVLIKIVTDAHTIECHSHDCPMIFESIEIKKPSFDCGNPAHII